MSRVMVFGLAVVLIAGYLLTQRRKIEFELEIEPKDERDSALDDPALA
jgi:hypothetical protein